MLLGATVSTAGGIDLAVDRIEALGGEALQIFTQSPRQWKPTEHDPARIERFVKRRDEAGVRYVLCHAVYLINLASWEPALYERSRNALQATIEVAGKIGGDVVVHAGSRGSGPLKAALDRIARALAPTLECMPGSTHVLLENSAGGGGTVGRSVDELAAIFDRLGGHPRLGLCLDTCHLWASGIDITDEPTVDRLAREIEAGIGLDRVRALHVNDTNDRLGSNRDAHASIGEGILGKRLGTLLAHPAFTHLPAILETPGRNGHGPDALEMRRLRRVCREAGVLLESPRRRPRRPAVRQPGPTVS